VVQRIVDARDGPKSIRSIVITEHLLEVFIRGFLGVRPDETPAPNFCHTTLIEGLGLPPPGGF
jgi:hypothetical protein